MASNFSPQHRFLIAAWYEVYHSPVVVQRLYRCRFGSNASVPSAKSIKAIHHRTSVDGILTDRPRSGRPVTASKPENVQLVMNTFAAQPTTSTRVASRQLHLSRSTVQRKIHQHELHPYRLRQLQELSPEDCANRCQFAEDFGQVCTENNKLFSFFLLFSMCFLIQQALDADPQLLNEILWSDEVNFHLCGEVNRHNCRYWSADNPHFHTTVPLHSPKVVVWCGVWRGG